MWHWKDAMLCHCSEHVFCHICFDQHWMCTDVGSMLHLLQYFTSCHCVFMISIIIYGRYYKGMKAAGYNCTITLSASPNSKRTSLACVLYVWGFKLLWLFSYVHSMAMAAPQDLIGHEMLRSVTRTSSWPIWRKLIPQSTGLSGSTGMNQPYSSTCKIINGPAGC